MNLWYPDQYFDAETATNYNLFRNEPAIGRYQESDPTGLAGGISTFAYVGENPLNWSDHTGQNPDVPPEQLPVPPTVVPAESGTLPEVPTIIPAADPSNTSSPNSSDPDNPQQPQTQQPDANAGACTSIEHAGTATAGLGGVAFLWGSVTDAGVVTAPIGVSMQLSGGIGMAVGGITYAIGDAGIYFGLCN